MDRTPQYAVRVLGIMLLVIATTGCTRWKPETSSPVKLTRACPLQRAPAVTDYGEAGVYAMYHYVVQGASGEELTAFTLERKSRGFAVAMMTMNINGKDTLFVRGAKAMRTQDQVDEEFDVSCGAGSEHVYLTHVFYQPFDPDNPDPISARVR